MTLGELVAMAEESPGGEEWADYRIDLMVFGETEAHPVKHVIFDPDVKGTVTLCHV
jgi:hypothetical protein